MAASVVTTVKMGIYSSDISQVGELLQHDQDWFRESEVQAWQEAAALQAAVELYWESTGCSDIQAVHSRHLHDEKPCQGFLVESKQRLVNKAKLVGFTAVQYMIVYQLVEQLAINVVFFTDAVSISQLQVHHQHITSGHACCLATMTI